MAKVVSVSVPSTYCSLLLASSYTSRYCVMVVPSYTWSQISKLPIAASGWKKHSMPIRAFSCGPSTWTIPPHR